MTQVEELNSDKNYIYYKTTCSCHGNDMTILLEHDEEIDILTLYTKVTGPAPYYYKDDPWHKSLWNRIKCATKILFNGQIDYEEAFIFRGDKHIQDFITALQEGLTLLKNGKANDIL